MRAYTCVCVFMLRVFLYTCVCAWVGGCNGCGLRRGGAGGCGCRCMRACIKSCGLGGGPKGGRAAFWRQAQLCGDYHGFVKIGTALWRLPWLHGDRYGIVETAMAEGTAA